MAEINARFNKVLIDSELTRTAAAKKLKITQQHVSKLCADGTLSDRMISDICREFGVSERWLRTGEGDMHAQLALADEVASYLGKLMANDPEDDIQREFVAMMKRSSPEFWAGLKTCLDEWTALWTEIQQEKK